MSSDILVSSLENAYTRRSAPLGALCYDDCNMNEEEFETRVREIADQHDTDGTEMVAKLKQEVVSKSSGAWNSEIASEVLAQFENLLDK